MAPPTPAASALPRGRVLLAEDDAAIRQLVVEALTVDGYDVVAAPDGAAALTLVGPHWRPDLILLDVSLPGTDGRAFAAAYHEMPGPHAPIVLLTDTQGVDAAECTEEIGAIGFLCKPFDLDALTALVRLHVPARHAA